MRDDALVGKASGSIRALALRQVRRVFEARLLAAQRSASQETRRQI
jgi:hypothetical protein